MYKKNILIIITIGCFNTFANEVLEPNFIHHGFSIKKTLTKRKCSVEVIKKYSNLHKGQILKVGDYVNLPLCFGKKNELPVFDDKDLNIIQWKPLLTKKGFILSNHLYYNELCKNIWTKQIYSFMKKNKHIKNINNVKEKQNIYIQSCASSIKKDETTNNSNHSLVDFSDSDESLTLNEKVAPYFLSIIKEKYLNYSLGQKNNTQTFASFGLRGNLVNYTGYNFSYDVVNHDFDVKFEMRNKKKSGIFFNQGLKYNNYHDKYNIYLGIGYMHKNEKQNYEISLSKNIDSHLNTWNINSQLLFNIKNNQWIGASLNFDSISAYYNHINHQESISLIHYFRF